MLRTAMAQIDLCMIQTGALLLARLVSQDDSVGLEKSVVSEARGSRCFRGSGVRAVACLSDRGYGVVAARFRIGHHAACFFAELIRLSRELSQGQHAADHHPVRGNERVACSSPATADGSDALFPATGAAHCLAAQLHTGRAGAAHGW